MFMPHQQPVYRTQNRFAIERCRLGKQQRAEELEILIEITVLANRAQILVVSKVQFLGLGLPNYSGHRRSLVTCSSDFKMVQKWHRQAAAIKNNQQQPRNAPGSIGRICGWSFEYHRPATFNLQNINSKNV